eukprot:gene12631-14830_t
MANPKGVAIGGGVLLVVGIVLFIISLATMPGALKSAANSAIKENVIVSSPSSSRYGDWAGASSQENDFIQYYYAYNLTNAFDVITNGAKPIFDQVGPFNYKYTYVYNNVSFAEDGDYATYSQVKYYEFDANSSYPLTEDVMITNINPPFLAFLSQSDNMGQLVMGGSSGPEIMYQIQNYFANEAFVQLAIGYNNIALFTQKLAALVASGVDMPTFYTNWANATVAPTPAPTTATPVPTTATPVPTTSAVSADPSVWQYMLSSEGDAPSGISASIATTIFDQTSPLSFLNAATGFATWYNAVPLNNTASQGTLIQGLGLTQTQFSIVAKWWYITFGQNVSIPAMLQSCKMTQLESNTDFLDLSFCQVFFQGALLGTSVFSLQGLTTPYSLNGNPFEYPSVYVNHSIDDTTPQAITNAFINLGESSLATITGSGELINNFTQGTFPAGTTAWSFSKQTAENIATYFMTTAQSYGYLHLNSLMTPMVATPTKSVRDWLWNCDGTDPLLNYFGLGGAVACDLQQNATIVPPSTIYTGKSDETLTNYLTMWQGMTEVPWAQPVKVEGYTESGQFAPNQDEMEEMVIFEENIFRPVTLQYFNATTVDGIKCRRYYLQNNSFPADPNTFFNQHAGMANLTSFQNGVPTFVTLWDMYEVDPAYSTDLVDGLYPSYENASIPLDLEPTSGNALYYNLKLQLNFQVASKAGWDDGTFTDFRFNVSNNRYYPSWKIGQTAFPSQDTLDSLKKQLKQLRALKIVPVVVSAIVGSLLFVGGVIMTIYGGMKWKNLSNYDPINEH